MSRMNPEVKEKWLEALRSGRYIQGCSYLRKGDTYCCLGVLTDLYIQEHEGENWVRNDSFLVPETYNTYSHKGCRAHPSREVAEWAGFESTNSPVVRTDDSELPEALADLNDGHGLNQRCYSFEEIADLIELNL